MHLCMTTKNSIIQTEAILFRKFTIFCRLHTSKRVDGLHLCGSACGIYSEEHAYCGRESNCDNYSREFHLNRYIHIARHGERADRSQYKPYQSAKQAQYDRLGQELEQYCGGLCAERFSDTDFARSFRYGDEHYIHNADTADEQRYRADRRDEGCEHVDNSIKKVDISCHIYERTRRSCRNCRGGYRAGSLQRCPRRQARNRISP